MNKVHHREDINNQVDFVIILDGKLTVKALFEAINQSIHIDCLSNRVL